MHILPDPPVCPDCHASFKPCHCGRPMIADDIIEAAARHRKIKPAVEQMVELMYQEPQSNTSEVSHEFECVVRGQKFDVEITLRVSTKKKHDDAPTDPHHGGKIWNG